MQHTNGQDDVGGSDSKVVLDSFPAGVLQNFAPENISSVLIWALLNLSDGALKGSEIVLLEGVSAVFGKIFVNVKKAEEVSSSVRGENPGNGPQEGVCSITEQNPGCTTVCLYICHFSHIHARAATCPERSKFEGCP